MKYAKKNIVLSILAVFAVSLLPSTAFAYDNNLVIVDQVMDDYQSMTASEINSFLNTFPSSCISPNSGFKAVDPTGYNKTGGFLYGGLVSAGTVIYHAAQAYEINPQVLISTMQKEQSLITGGGGCSTKTIAKAMGYGCPDSGGSYSYSGVSLYSRNGTNYTSVSSICVNSKPKVGFSQQVIHAAWMLKYSRMRAEGKIGWAIVKGNWDNSDDLDATYSGYMTEGCFKRSRFEANCTDYDGLATIDKTTIHMDNGATAALYRYTPHFSGNQHFTDIFTGWFGPPTLVFKSLDTPRWMQTKADTYKKDLKTGENIDTVIPAGTQLYFPTKADLGGILYLRTQSDTIGNLKKGILYSDLEELPMTYSALAAPRWMKTTMNLNKIDPRTGKQIPGVVPSGMQIYFPTKITIGGVQYLRTQVDSDAGLETGIPFYNLTDADVSYQNFEAPRWMQAKTNTHLYDIRKHIDLGSTIIRGTQQYFDHKITVNGTTYASNGTPANAGDFTGVPLADLEEIPMNFIKMEAPRWMLTKDGITKKDPVTGSSVGSAFPVGTQIEFNTKIMIGGQWYLRTKSDSMGNLKQGILLSDLTETAPGFTPLKFVALEAPRKLRTTSATYKVNLSTGDNYGTQIAAGTEIFFNTKVQVGGHWYLRAYSDASKGFDLGILWPDNLEELN